MLTSLLSAMKRLSFEMNMSTCLFFQIGFEELLMLKLPVICFILEVFLSSYRLYTEYGTEDFESGLSMTVDVVKQL